MSKKFTNHKAINCIVIFLIASLSLSAQRIISFNPISGRVGTTVTITGTGFDPVAGNNIVYFGATKATVTSASATQLVVIVPTGATFQPISVTKGGLTAYSARPFILTFGCAPVAVNATTTFSEKINFSTGTFSSPVSIAIADFDGDGKPDIASTNQDNNSVAVFRNTSGSATLNNASFAPPVNFLTVKGPAGIAIGDIDGDGKLDIAITTTSSTVEVLRNTSSQGTALSFAAPASLLTSTGPTDSAGTANINISDLDGDGKPDLIVTNPLKSSISIFRNIGSTGTITRSSFGARTDLGAGAYPIGLVVTDIDGDGKPDIAVNNGYGFTLSIYRNTGTSGTISFAGTANLIIQLGTAGLAAGDLNNDGKPELVLTNLLDNSISIFPNNAIPGSINFFSFGPSINLATPTNPVTPVISDFNGDGKPDIAITSFDVTAQNTNSNPLSLFANNITGSTISSSSFLPRVDLITGGSFGRFTIGDLDGDGKPDLVIPNYSSDIISVLKNNASVFTSLPPSTVNGLNAVCDDGISKNYYDPSATNRIICSIRDNGNNLGSTNARVYVDAAPANYNSTYFMGRHYVINPSAQPVSNVQVRLYFTIAEFNALKALDNRLSGPGDLSITKYQGPTEDGVFNPADATSLSIIPPSSIVFGTAFGGYYADFTVNSLSEFWFSSGAVALPVQLLYFKAEKLGDAVSLQWSTASETNNDYFTVERSADGSNFSAIAIVKAGGSTSQPRVYEVKDPAPLHGLNHYRLKQTDKDGKISYSAIKTVEWQGTLRITIAPQPIKATATVNFYAKAGTNNFVIYNAQGAVVQTYQLNRGSNGNAQLTIQKNKLAAGIYFYKIFNANKEMYRGKLIVE